KRRTNRSTPPEAAVAPCTASPPPLRALRSSPQAPSLRERDFSFRPAPRACCRRVSIALPPGFRLRPFGHAQRHSSFRRAPPRRMNSAARASGQSERREKVQPGPSSDAIMAGRTRPPGPASSTPGAVVFGYFSDDLERLGLLFVYPGHFRFVGHVVEGQREHNVKSLFRSHGATSQWVQRAREAPFEIIQNGGKRDACRRERDCNDIVLIPVSCAGAVVRHGFAPPAWFTVRLFLFKRAHSSTK